ncbi:hypothetical protein ONS95_002403 [Cadophora gregata]|uniref:uncharacterized protein n=1 Tax=Cadophora gregata TaxID=51156 RepID=UPI0026DC0B67|nr:uncharacterized protein ONS95_002403 [Cadophora gregata]KAK0109724.1 hypothetical protein ONS95_002403 [Cadophora gregata]
MHISRVALVPTLLAVAGSAFPLNTRTVNATLFVSEATKPFSDHYTSVVGDGEYTATAHETPTTTSFSVSIFESSTGSTPPFPTAIIAPPPFPNINITKHTTQNSTLNSNSYLFNPLVLDTIRSILETYNVQYGPPTETERESLPAREQIMLDNLFHLTELLPCEERAAAETIAELVLQKAMRANVMPEAEDLDSEEIGKVVRIVESITSELFHVVDDGDSNYPLTFQVCNARGTDDEAASNNLHALVPRSPKSKSKWKSKSKKPTICPDGSVLPATAEQGSPPLKEWQLAQKQDRELKKHLKKKEKSDKTRDHMRIVSTTFASISCVISPATCPILAVKGIL